MTSASMQRSVQSIALVCPGGIGDVLLFSSVIRACKAMLPAANITLLVEGRSQAAAQLLGDVVDEVIPLKLQGVGKLTAALGLRATLCAGKYGAVVSCGSNALLAPLLASTGIPVRVGFESALSGLCLTQSVPCRKQAYAGDMYLALARGLAVALGQPFPREIHHCPVIPLTVDDTTWFTTTCWPKLNIPNPSQSWVVIHPGVSKLSIQKGLVKRWNPANWVTLANRLRENNITVVLAAGPDDADTVAAIQQGIAKTGQPALPTLAGAIKNLKELAIAFKHAAAVVCCDSAPMHVAMAAGATTVALFGDFAPHRLVPPSATHVTALAEPAGTLRPNPSYVAIEVSAVETAVLAAIHSTEGTPAPAIPSDS